MEKVKKVEKYRCQLVAQAQMIVLAGGNAYLRGGTKEHRKVLQSSQSTFL